MTTTSPPARTPRQVKLKSGGPLKVFRRRRQQKTVLSLNEALRSITRSLFLERIVSKSNTDLNTRPIKISYTVPQGSTKYSQLENLHLYISQLFI